MLTEGAKTDDGQNTAQGRSVDGSSGQQDIGSRCNAQRSHVEQSDR